MRKTIFLFFIIIFSSCSNKRSISNKENNSFEISSNNASQDTYIKSYEDLSIQKLKNYFDLLNLEKQHPEFKNDITDQINKLSSEITLKNKYTTPVIVSNIHKVGKEIKINDSLKKIKLAFKISHESNQVSDSIYVKIHTSLINIDGREITTNKIKFSKE